MDRGLLVGCVEGAGWGRTTTDPPKVELLKPTDWRALRTTRLRALRDAPDAYTSTHNVESRWNHNQWRDQLAAGQWAVAVDRHQRIGMAGLVRSTDEPPHVEWAWVAPSHRNRGVLRLMIDFLIVEAHKAQLPRLRLWVLKDNTDALAAYQKLGFSQTGEEQEIQTVDSAPNHRKPRYEVRLQREL